MEPNRRNSGQTRIVVVGGGFGGAFAVQRLARRLGVDEAEVLLIDRNNFFVFHPFLVEAGTGSLPPQHAVVGLRAFTGARGLLMGEFTGADFGRAIVRVAARGAGPRTGNPIRRTGPGLRQRHQPAPDSRVCTNTLGRSRAWPTPSPCATGPSACWSRPTSRTTRTASVPAALRDRRQQLHRRRGGRRVRGLSAAGQPPLRQRRERDIRITLVDIADRILPNLDPELAASPPTSCAPRHRPAAGHLGARSRRRPGRCWTTAPAWTPRP